jgi:hypothetical protein
MNSPRSKTACRWFYSSASFLLLLITFIGFRLFYLQGQSFPGRPLTPPMRTLLIVHGCVMTLWIVLAAAQPILIASGKHRNHRVLGCVGAALAACVVVLGLRVGIEATRFAPPELKLFGLAPLEFMAVPVLGILAFAGFVIVGIANRRNPDLHRPMMFMATLSITSAPIGRIPILNFWYAGTILEYWFSAFLVTLLIGLCLLAIKSYLSKTLDRGFAMAYGVLVLVCAMISIIAKTQIWTQFATWLVG